MAQPPTPSKQYNIFTATSSWNTAANWLPAGVPVSGTDVVLGFGSSVFQTAGGYTSSFNLGAYDLNALVFNSFAASNTSVALQGAAAADTLRFATVAGTLPAIYQTATGRAVIQNGAATAGITLDGGTTLRVLGDGPGELQLLATIVETNGASGLLIDETGTRGFNTAGLVRLTGANTFTGGVTLSGGNLLLGSNTAGAQTIGALGTGALTVNAADGRTTSLQFDPLATGTLTLNNPITLTTGLTVTGTNTATVPNPIAVFGGAVTGPGGLTFANSNGSLVYHLTNSGNTFQGPVVIAPVGNTVVTASLGTAAVGTGTATGASGFTVVGNSSLTLDNRTTAVARTSGTAPLTLQRGNLNYFGNGTADSAETFGTLTVNGTGSVGVLGTTTTAQTQTVTFASLNRGAFGTGTLSVVGTNLGSGTGAGESVVRFTTNPGGAVGGADSGVTRPILPYVFADAAASTVTATGTRANGFVRYDAGTGRLVPLTAAEYAGNFGTAPAPANNVRLASSAALPNAFGQVTAFGPTAVNSLVLSTNTAAINRIGVSASGPNALTVTGGAILSTTNGANTDPSLPSVISVAGLNLGTTGYVHTVAGLTIASPISGSGGLVKSGFGTLNLVGANPFTGGLTTNSGLLTFGDDANLGAAGQPLTLNGGLTGGPSLSPQSLYVSPTATAVTVNRPTTVGPAGTAVNVALQNNVLTLAGDIGGTGQIQKSGAGVLALTGSNTAFTGNISVPVGTLAVNSDAALGGAGAGLILSGGALQPTASFTTGKDVLVTAGSTIFTPAGMVLTLGGNVTSQEATRTLLKEGPGEVVLTATNTFLGTYQSGGSAVTVRGAGLSAPVGSGRTTLSGANGALPLASQVFVLVGGEVVLDNSAAVNNNRVGTVTVAMGGGAFTLRGNAAASVNESIAATSFGVSTSAPYGGTITLDNPNAGFQTNLYSTSIAGGATVYGTLYVRGTNLGGGGVNGPADGSGSYILAVQPGIQGGLIANAVGSQSVTGDPTSFLTVNNVVTAGNPTQFNAVLFTNYTVPSAGTALEAGNIATTYDVAAAGVTFAGASAANAIRIREGNGLDLGGGTLTLENGTAGAGHILSTTGTNTITNGTLQFGTAFPARLTVAAGGELAVGAVVAGGGPGLVKFGGGALTLNTPATFVGVSAAGGIAVAGGTLRYGVANALPAANGVLVNAGATLDLNNTTSTLAFVGSFGNVNLGTGSLTLSATANPTVAFGGSFVGTAASSLTKTNTNTFTVAGDSPNFAGTVQVNGGTLAVQSNTALGTGPLQIGDGTTATAATLSLAATVTSLANPITVQAQTGTPTAVHAITAAAGVATLSGNIAINNTSSSTTTGGITLTGIGLRLNGASGQGSGQTTLAGTVSGAGGLFVFSGNWGFAGDNTYAGGTLIDTTTATVMGVGRDSTPSGVGAAVTSGPFGTGPVLFSTGFGANLRADGGARTIANQVNLSSTGGYFGVGGTNPLTLNGAFDLQGATVAQTVVVTNTAPTSIGGPIQNGTGGLTKNGPGELRVTNTANTYTGATTVNAGTLRLAGGTAAAPNIPGALTVNPGAVLAGTGAVGGLTTVAATGVVSPGTAGPGTLTAAGGAAFGTGSVFRVELAGAVVSAAANTGGSGTAGTNNSLLVGGAATGLSFADGTAVVVDITGIAFGANTPYSFTVGQSVASNSIAGTPVFTFLSNGVDVSGFVNSPSLGIGGSSVYLNFTPVPEPATVLAVAAGGLGLLRLRRRVIG